LANGKGTQLGKITQSADDLLAEFVRDGREEAFGEVVRRYAGMVFSVCLRVTNNAHDAEDATQATFLTLAVQCKSGKPVNRLGPWLQQVARRAALDVRRGRKRRETHEQRHADERLQEAAATLRDQDRNGHPNGAASGGGDIDLEKLNTVLAEELGRLPAKYRLPLLSLYFGGMSRDEIARELGCTVGTLGVRIHRARQLLARRLSERGIAPAGRLLAGGVLAAAIVAIGRAMMIERTTAAAARAALGHDLAATTAAKVIATLKGTAVATMLAKLKGVAVVAVLASITFAAAGGTIRHWDALAPHVPDALRRMIDWARMSRQVPLPRPAAPSIPTPIATAPPVTNDPVALALSQEQASPTLASTGPRGAPVRAPAAAPPSGGGGPLRVAVAQPVTGWAPGRVAPQHLSVAPVPPAGASGAPRAAIASVAVPPVRRRADAAARPNSGGTGGASQSHDVRPNLRLGTGAAERVHDLSGRTLIVHGGGPGAIDIGPQGLLRLGANGAGGTIVQPLGPASPRPAPLLPFDPNAPARPQLPPSLIVRGDPAGAGTVEGWGGAIGDGGALLNNGRVIADGRGVDRALIFVGYGAVSNTLDNPVNGGNSGWYARNGGRLVLPKIAVAPGTHTYTWGESPDDPTIDLVNSVRVTLRDAQNPGRLDVSLLDKNRADVPALPTGHTFIGVWSIDLGLTRPSTVDLTVRYDDGLAAALRLDEAVLKLWRYDGGQWLRINDATFGRDLENHLLSGSTTSLSFFAVSAPEPSSLGLVLIGALGLLRRRRR
jgi:RNA polymerase sigma factor (sigma-70 family)